MRRSGRGEAEGSAELALDVLFVVDEGSSALANEAMSFIERLDAQAPPTTSIHVAVTSAEVGGLPHGTSCGNMAGYAGPDEAKTSVSGTQGRFYLADGLTYAAFAAGDGSLSSDLRFWINGQMLRPRGWNRPMPGAAVRGAFDPVNEPTNGGVLREDALFPRPLPRSWPAKPAGSPGTAGDRKSLAFR